MLQVLREEHNEYTVDDQLYPSPKEDALIIGHISREILRILLTYGTILTFIKFNNFGI